MGPAAHHDPQADREQRRGKELGTHRQIRDGYEERPDGQPRGRALRDARGAARQVDEREGDPHEHALGQREPGPSEMPEHEGQEHLGPPLLVEPRPPERREREGVRTDDVMGVQHDVPRADVVGEVDGVEAEPHQDDGRERDREELVLCLGRDERDGAPAAARRAAPERGDGDEEGRQLAGHEGDTGARGGRVPLAPAGLDSWLLPGTLAIVDRSMIADTSTIINTSSRECPHDPWSNRTVLHLGARGSPA